MVRNPYRWARDVLTLNRWNTNPFQMYDLALLMAFSLAQIIFGFSEKSIQVTELDATTGYWIAFANLVGGTIAMCGLLLKDLETSVLLEFWGYLSLIGTMGIYVGLLIFTREFPNTTYALGLSEAFVLAGSHRMVQLVKYWRAKKKHDALTLALNEKIINESE